MTEVVYAVVGVVSTLATYVIGFNQGKQGRVKYLKGMSIQYLNKNNQIELATVWEDALETAGNIIVKRDTARYTPPFVIKVKSITNVDK